jgi:hypothetical protein
MVMLLTVLTVAFMMRAGSEKQSSGFYRAEAMTRDLSDTTLNLVEGAINEATTQGMTYTWTSQPGAIRVFDNTGASYKTFKLYSAPSMSSLATVANPVSTFLSTDSPPTNWYTAPGRWVDLNAPVNSDPNPNSAGLGSPTYTHFPILDPRDPVTSTKTIAMDGFALPAPGTSVPFDTTNIDNNNKPNPAPMPVQWLYILQDGSLTAPTSGPDASGNYSFTGAGSAPMASNPIVGRVAFWTDDETCKVNVNTAGADGVMGTTANKDRADPNAIANGTFWSPPYFAAIDDYAPSLNTASGQMWSGPYGQGFASSEPVSGEYQRYPGHPATVALSNILNTLRPSASTPYINTTTFYNTSTSVAGVTPRYVYGGTQENTLNTFGTGSYYSTNNNLSLTQEMTASFRLYPTLSEALFHPDRTVTTNLNTASASDTASRQRMETGHFFLTAHSRAPELNLFGLPRVSIWPMAFNTSNRTVVDNLIGFCTTIGGTQGNTTNSSAYYFTRSSCSDSTIDIGLQDSSGKSRNALLLNYLDYLTRQNIPGFGGNFYAKNYGTPGSPLTGQNDQILSEIFDYVRMTNIQDGSSPSPYNGGIPASSSWNGYGVTYTASNAGWWGVGQVVPSLINSSTSGGILNWNTQGNGSYPRLIEATLQFVAMGRVGTTATGTGPAATTFGTASLTTSAVVNPAVMTFAANYPGMLAVGDSSSTLTYPYAPSGTPSLDLPYAKPGATGGAPTSGPYNTVYPVLNTETGLISGVPPDGTTAVEGFLIFTFINPAQDWIYCSPCVWGSVAGLSAFAINGHNLGFTDPECMLFGSGQDWHGGGRSGYTPVDIDFQGRSLTRIVGSSVANIASSGYPFFSNIIPITSTNQTGANASTMSFTGGPITIRLYDQSWGYNTPLPMPTSAGAPTGGHLVQTYSINFPTSNIPVPILPPNPTPTASTAAQYYNSKPPVLPTDPPLSDNRDNEYPPNSVLPMGPGSGNPNPDLTKAPSYSLPTQATGNPMTPWVTPYIAYPGTGNSPSPYTSPQTPSVVACFEQSGPIVGGMSDPTGDTPFRAFNPPYPTALNCYAYGRWNQAGYPILIANENFIGTGDVVESMVLSQAWSDPRLLAISKVPATAWTTHPNWGKQFAHNLWWGMVLPSVGNGTFNKGQSWEVGTNGWLVTDTPSVGTLAGNVVEPQPAPAPQQSPWPTFGWAPSNGGPSSSTNGNNLMPMSLSGLVSGKYPPNSTPIDWDSGIAESDGPWINKADEGSAGAAMNIPYTANPAGQPPQLFTANREVCSPGMLGSLPTGVDPTGANPAGWQTLLFRPGPGAAGYSGMTHPGEGVPVTAGVFSPPYTSPPDHLWMDLFWVPVTEPYAISEPMSTAGKINLNYQILPFTYIKRATALRAAMATEKIPQVGLIQSPTCKGYYQPFGVTLNNGTSFNGVFNYNYGGGAANGQQVNARFPIDLDVTLSQFDKKFNNWDVFRSASQICENFLVPMDDPNILPNGTAAPSSTGTYYQIVTPTGNYPLPATSGDTTGAADFAKDWYTPVATPQVANAYTNAPFAMVGDNLREQPYAHLYGKLTTKSNTFTVYYRVQSLKKPSTVTADWNENLGAVTGEYRGSTTIERFIDPNEKLNGVNVVPDAAAQLVAGNTPTSLEGYYKWRVVENHQFAP